MIASMSDDRSQLMKYPEAAKFLRMGVRKLERLVASRRVPVVRIDGHVLFKAASLVEWINALEEKPNDEGN